MTEAQGEQIIALLTSIVDVLSRQPTADWLVPSVMFVAGCIAGLATLRGLSKWL